MTAPARPRTPTTSLDGRLVRYVHVVRTINCSRCGRCSFWRSLFARSALPHTCVLNRSAAAYLHDSAQLTYRARMQALAFIGVLPALHPRRSACRRQRRRDPWPDNHRPDVSWTPIRPLRTTLNSLAPSRRDRR